MLQNVRGVLQFAILIFARQLIYQAEDAKEEDRLANDTALTRDRRLASGADGTCDTFDCGYGQKQLHRRRRIRCLPSCQIQDCCTTLAATCPQETQAATTAYRDCVADPAGWTRPYGDVAISAAGAESCRNSCSSGGYQFFGLECPMGTQVHCQCSNAMGGTSKASSYCKGLGNPLHHAHHHCVGPYEKDGLLFGDYLVSSVYSTEASVLNQQQTTQQAACSMTDPVSSRRLSSKYSYLTGLTLEACMDRCVSASSCGAMSWSSSAGGTCYYTTATDYTTGSYSTYETWTKNCNFVCGKVQGGLYPQKSDFGTITCEYSPCNVSDCCGTTAQCNSFVCPVGQASVELSEGNLAHRRRRYCAGSTCTAPECCSSSVSMCANFQCPVGQVHNTSVLDSFCAGSTSCVQTCCQAGTLGNCDSYACPAGYAPWSSTDSSVRRRRVTCATHDCAVSDCCSYTRTCASIDFSLCGTSTTIVRKASQQYVLATGGTCPEGSYRILASECQLQIENVLGLPSLNSNIRRRRSYRRRRTATGFCAAVSNFDAMSGCVEVDFSGSLGKRLLYVDSPPACGASTMPLIRGYVCAYPSASVLSSLSASECPTGYSKITSLSECLDIGASHRAIDCIANNTAGRVYGCSFHPASNCLYFASEQLPVFSPDRKLVCKDSSLYERMTCAGSECTKNECCTSPPMCRGHICSNGLVPKNAAIGSTYCSQSTCTDDECCGPAGVCSSAVCGASFVSRHGLKCTTAECTFAECCSDTTISTPDSCSSVNCGSDLQRTGYNTIVCAGTTCTQGECCVARGACADFDCSGVGLLNAGKACSSGGSRLQSMCGSGTCCRYGWTASSLRCNTSVGIAGEPSSYVCSPYPNFVQTWGALAPSSTAPSTCSGATCTSAECCVARATCSSYTTSSCNTDGSRRRRGTNNVYVARDAATECAGETCMHAECCEKRASCSSSSDFSAGDCPPGWKGGKTSVLCATGNCRWDECCLASPTCASFNSCGGSSIHRRRRTNPVRVLRPLASQIKCDTGSCSDSVCCMDQANCEAWPCDSKQSLAPRQLACTTCDMDTCCGARTTCGMSYPGYSCGNNKILVQDYAFTDTVSGQCPDGYSARYVDRASWTKALCKEFASYMGWPDRTESDNGYVSGCAVRLPGLSDDPVQNGVYYGSAISTLFTTYQSICWKETFCPLVSCESSLCCVWDGTTVSIPGADCSNYVCSAYSSLASTATHRRRRACIGRICAEPECCVQNPRCDSFTCSSSGAYDKPDKNNIRCIGSTCTSEECCDEKEYCDNIICTMGYSNVLNRRRGILCNNQRCALSECCYAPTTCGVFSGCTYDSGFSLKDNAASITCAGAKCTTSECCNSRGDCSTYTCSAGLIARSDSTCSGSECTEEECCARPHTCDAYSCESSGQLNKALAETLSCSTTRRRRASEDCSLALCCTDTAATCGNSTCIGQLIMSVPRENRRRRIVCQGGSCSVEQCCQQPQGCADTYASVCGTGKTYKSDYATQRCASTACTESECCTELATCDAYQCSSGTVPLSERRRRISCSSSTCQNAECCGAPGSCSSISCSRRRTYIRDSVASVQVDPDTQNGQIVSKQVSGACFKIEIGTSVQQSHSQAAGADCGTVEYAHNLGAYSDTSNSEQRYSGGSGNCYNGAGRASTVRVRKGPSADIVVAENPTCFYAITVTLQATATEIQNLGGQAATSCASTACRVDECCGSTNCGELVCSADNVPPTAVKSDRRRSSAWMTCAEGCDSQTCCEVLATCSQGYDSQGDSLCENSALVKQTTYCSSASAQLCSASTCCDSMGDCSSTSCRSGWTKKDDMEHRRRRQRCYASTCRPSLCCDENAAQSVTTTLSGALQLQVPQAQLSVILQSAPFKEAVRGGIQTMTLLPLVSWITVDVSAWTRRLELTTNERKLQLAAMERRLSSSTLKAQFSIAIPPTASADISADSVKSRLLSNNAQTAITQGIQSQNFSGQFQILSAWMNGGENGISVTESGNTGVPPGGTTTLAPGDAAKDEGSAETGVSSLVLICATVVALVALAGVGVYMYFKRCRGSASARVAPTPAVPASSAKTSRSSTITAASSGECDLIDEAEQFRGKRLEKEIDEKLPEYWNNKKLRQDESYFVDGGFDSMAYVSRDMHDKFDELLATTYKAKVTQDRPCPKKVGACAKTKGGCPCNQPGGDPGLPSEYRVRRVIRVEDSDMWSRYVQKKKEICEARGPDLSSLWHPNPAVVSDDISGKYPDIFAPLDIECNEMYLWHGTFVRNALSIAQNDFRIDMAGTGAGTMYGHGAYFGENCTKADEYAKDERDGYYQGIYCLLLCRVMMGRYFYTGDRDEKAGDRVKSGEFDSVLGDRLKTANTFREFVVFNADQVYPEYIVLYSRVHHADDTELVKAALRQTFHMELPVYWGNFHRDPRTDPFHEQYLVLPHVKDQIQQLISASLKAGEATVKRVRRIENSNIWNSYVDFKMALNDKLQQRQIDSEGYRSDVVSRFRVAREKCKRVSELDGNPDSGHVITDDAIHGNDVEQVISMDNLESDMNEFFLWHGTSRDAAESIVKSDFTIPKSGATHGSRFGHGAYFAEQLDKSLSYCTADRDGTKIILLCRVCCGEIYYTEEDSETKAHEAARRQEKTAVVANPKGKGPREFIVLDAKQVYPEFLCEVECS